MTENKEKEVQPVDIRKLNRILMRTVAVLLILVLVSTGMVTGRYARYTSSASGGDSARVARFSVTETVDFFSESETVCTSFIPGEKKEITIVVDNDSEVAIAYTIQADNPYENFPLRFYVKPEAEHPDMPFCGYMQPGETATYVLVADWNGGKDIAYSGRVDIIEITLNATQAD